MRALLFYAEIKEKRASKIKSKKYHRIKKKEKERLRKDGADDAEVDEEERMDVERKRAEERMSLRHRNGNKAVKALLGMHGQAAEV